MSEEKTTLESEVKGDAFEVKITGPGMSFTHKISGDLIPTILGVCYGTSTRNPSGVPEAQQDTQEQLSQRESLREYVNRLGPRTEAQRILTFAGYIKKHRGHDSFDRNAMKSLYREAQEVVPANLSRDISNAIRKGWVADDVEKSGSFYVTNSGEKMLESGELPGITRKRAKRSKPKADGPKGA